MEGQLRLPGLFTQVMVSTGLFLGKDSEQVIGAISALLNDPTSEQPKSRYTMSRMVFTLIDHHGINKPSDKPFRKWMPFLMDDAARNDGSARSISARDLSFGALSMSGSNSGKKGGAERPWSVFRLGNPIPCLPSAPCTRRGPEQGRCSRLSLHFDDRSRLGERRRT